MATVSSPLPQFKSCSPHKLCNHIRSHKIKLHQPIWCHSVAKGVGRWSCKSMEEKDVGHRLPLTIAANYLALCSYTLKSHLNKKADSQYSSFCLAAEGLILPLCCSSWADWKGLAGMGRHKIHFFRNLDRKSSSQRSAKGSKSLAGTSWPWIYLACWATEAA